MRIFRLNTNGSSRTVGLIGEGLIGSAIAASLNRHQPVSSDIHFPSYHQNDLDRVWTTVNEYLLKFKTSGAVDWIWSAGKAGLLASEEECAREFSFFEAFLDRLFQHRNNCNDRLHLVSSAGGLYEGQRLVTHQTKPAPTKAYGHLKLRMEDRAVAQFKHCHIYRPTSVFGAFKPGHRMGLITTLMVNAYQQKTTLVWGAPSTLRDYVSATDIGQFIGGAVLSETKGNSTTHILASGKPTSTQEIVHLIQAITQKQLYLRFVDATNSADITFAKNNDYSPHWQPENLETTVRHIHHQLLGL